MIIETGRSTVIIIMHNCVGFWPLMHTPRTRTLWNESRLRFARGIGERSEKDIVFTHVPRISSAEVKQLLWSSVFGEKHVSTCNAL